MWGLISLKDYNPSLQKRKTELKKNKKKRQNTDHTINLTTSYDITNNFCNSMWISTDTKNIQNTSCTML